MKKFLFLQTCIEEAEHWRGQLIEAVAEYDDKLMEKFFEDPATYY
jgi:elongation factor G